MRVEHIFPTQKGLYILAPLIFCLKWISPIHHTYVNQMQTLSNCSNCSSHVTNNKRKEEFPSNTRQFLKNWSPIESVTSDIGRLGR